MTGHGSVEMLFHEGFDPLGHTEINFLDRLAFRADEMVVVRVAGIAAEKVAGSVVAAVSSPKQSRPGQSVHDPVDCRRREFPSLGPVDLLTELLDRQSGPGIEQVVDHRANHGGYTSPAAAQDIEMHIRLNVRGCAPGHPGLPEEKAIVAAENIRESLVLLQMGCVSGFQTSGTLECSRAGSGNVACGGMQQAVQEKGRVKDIVVLIQNDTLPRPHVTLAVVHSARRGLRLSAVEMLNAAGRNPLARDGALRLRRAENLVEEIVFVKTFPPSSVTRNAVFSPRFRKGDETARAASDSFAVFAILPDQSVVKRNEISAQRIREGNMSGIGRRKSGPSQFLCSLSWLPWYDVLFRLTSPTKKKVPDFTALMRVVECLSLETMSRRVGETVVTAPYSLHNKFHSRRLKSYSQAPLIVK